VSDLVSTILSGVWPFVVTNIDDFVVLTALFVTVGHGGPSPSRIVLGQYAGIGALVAVSLAAAAGLALVPERWIGLLGFIPIALCVRGLVRARGQRREGVAPVAAVAGVAGVVGLTVANGADNVSVYIPLFRQAGPGATSVDVAVFAVLVGVWCVVARLVAGRKPLIALVQRVGHWLVPVVYVAIGIKILVTSGLITG
jgi:cadmium resistance protein CadD (predicted permease)